MRLLLFGNTRKARVNNTVKELEVWLKKRAETVVFDLAGEPKGPFSGDLAIALGGDGTFLRVSRYISAYGIPILGIHLGTFGFLSELTPKDMYLHLEKVLEGQYKLPNRILLRCQLVREGKVVKETLGINDAVISRASLSRLISVKLFINEEEVTNYSCDGIIISTPVGSTAHSLAAGGPILSPEMDAFIISLICPHTLTNRPLVISGDSKIEMEPYTEGVEMGLTVDGQLYEGLLNGDRVKVERADVRLRIVDTGIRSFYEVLREKLAWGGSPKYGNG
ncbi:MAG TPA: NAD(+)/NADH kinase [Candidatus Hypogeohydataceae bacterium YC41]